ncbi:V-type ATP synthase subunit I [Gammaproteobacteria bacterium]
MFKPLPMQRVTLHCLKDDAPTAVLALAEAGVMHPEETLAYEKDLPEFPGRDYQRLYHTAHSRLEKILHHLNLDPATFSSLPSRVVDEAELVKTNEELGEFWRQCSSIEEQGRRLDEENKLVDNLSQTLENFAVLDIDLGLLQGHTRFLDVRVGMVPRANLGRLREALGLGGHFLTVFREVGDNAHVVVTGLRGTRTDKEISTLLETAGWRSVPMPTEFKGHPEKLKQDLSNRRLVVNKGRLALREEKEVRYVDCSTKLVDAIQILRLAAPYAEVAEVLRGRGGLTMIQGWVPRNQIHTVQTTLEGRITHPFVFEVRDPTSEERSHVPSVVKHPIWLAPFQALVKNYGIPRYGEFDPSWLFTITYILMFGAMFGDLGQGAVIAGAGGYFHRRLGSATPFLVAIGISSMVFGVLYGSVFGFEDLLPALWMPPLSDPIRMLTLALSWGVGFIVLATLFTIHNRLVDGRVLEALLDSKGLAGIATYLGLLWGGYSWMAYGQFDNREWLGILIPLVLVLGYKWHEADFPPREKVLVVFIEGFDTMVNYLSSTLSFLRVAAFSLNHVALAIAIFTVAEMMGTAGHWTTVVLGNIFILVLEGGIVAIQVLRLEYYEGFSRFFSGDGREFRPLMLRRS